MKNIVSQHVNISLNLRAILCSYHSICYQTTVNPSLNHKHICLQGISTIGTSTYQPLQLQPTIFFAVWSISFLFVCLLQPTAHES